MLILSCTFQVWYLAWNSSRHLWTGMDKTEYQWELYFKCTVPMEDSNEILGGKKCSPSAVISSSIRFKQWYYSKRQRRMLCITQCSLSEMKYSILFLPTLDSSAIITLSNSKYSWVGRNNLTREDAFVDHTVITVLY